MNIVITGGTSGLGEALVKKFEKDGHKVIVLARSAQGENQIPCDVSNEDNVKNAFTLIGNKFEKIDILINNAGIALAGVTELIPMNEIKKIMDVNFYGVLYSTRYALPLMTENSKIINISSPCGDFPLPFRTMYCVTKSAVSMLSYCLNMELYKAKIQVSAICPGNIFTNLSKNRVKIEETNQRYGDSIQKATEKINKEANNRMTLEYASNKIYKIINKTHLKPQYVIGGKYKFLYFLARITPKSLLMWGTKKFSQ